MAHAEIAKQRNSETATKFPIHINTLAVSCCVETARNKLQQPGTSRSVAVGLTCGTVVASIQAGMLQVEVKSVQLLDVTPLVETLGCHQRWRRVPP
jgi:hypothetical protein